MSRIRSIKPEFFVNAQVAECSVAARLLFIGLWCFCDDAGRHTASPKQAKAEVFPSDNVTIEDVSAMLDELSANDLIEFYEVADKRYFYVTGWHHQKINRPQPPRYPEPSFSDHSVNGHGMLTDHSSPIRSDTRKKELPAMTDNRKPNPNGETIPR